MRRKNLFFFIISIIILSSVNHIQGMAQSDGEDIVIGKRVRFFSKLLNEERTIEVSLPAGYQNSKVKYPVLYVLDGGDVFQNCVSVVRMLAPNHFPHLIVIGIPNANRNRDLDPNNLKLPQPDKNANRFLEVLKNELIPYVENKYRARPFRLLTGHSLAGFFTVHTMLREPDMFRAYIATSPSMGGSDDEAYINKIETILKKGGQSGNFLYFSVGEKEGERIKGGTQRFLKILKRTDPKTLDWRYDHLVNEGHIPIKGFYNGMKAFYSDWLVPAAMFYNPDLKKIEEHYNTLSGKYGYKIIPPEGLINSLGYGLVRQKKYDQAIDLFRYNVKIYPNSWNVYDSLAEAYMLKGDREKAVKNYKKSVELNPQNNNGISMIEKLKK